MHDFGHKISAISDKFPRPWVAEFATFFMSACLYQRWHQSTQSWPWFKKSLFENATTSDACTEATFKFLITLELLSIPTYKAPDPVLVHPMMWKKTHPVYRPTPATHALAWTYPNTCESEECVLLCALLVCTHTPLQVTVLQPGVTLDQWCSEGGI